MGKNVSSLTKEGTLAAIATGVRVRIDPELRDQAQNVLAPDEVDISGGFVVVSVQDDPLGVDFGTFDVQNITDDTQTLAWTATAQTSIQYNSLTAKQTTVGTNGSNPSPLAAMNISNVSGDYEPVRVASLVDLDTVGNGVWVQAGSGPGATLTAGNPGLTTLDGTQLADGDRVLLTDQTVGTENGVYVASDTAVGLQTVLTRATDADDGTKLLPASIIKVFAGTEAVGSIWQLVAPNTIVDVDVSAQVWHRQTLLFRVPGAAAPQVNSAMPANTSWNFGANVITGEGAASFGGSNTVGGQYAFAEGYGNAANGYGSHAEGVTTTSYGIAAHAEGFYTYAYGRASHAEGQNVVVTGRYSHAEGFGSYSPGWFAHAEGRYALSTGNYSHCEGQNCESEGSWSHAQGYETLAYGSYSHAEGIYSEAIAEGSHAQGENSWAYLKGMAAISSGALEKGGSQMGAFTMTATTLAGSGAQSKLLIGNTDVLIIPTPWNRTIALRLDVVVRRMDTSPDSAYLTADCLVRTNGNNTVTVVGESYTFVYGEGNLTLANLDIDFNAPGTNELEVLVQALNLADGENLRWSARVTTSEIAETI